MPPARSRASRRQSHARTGDRAPGIVRAAADGVSVEVRVAPRSRPRLEVADGGLVLGVAAAPVGGAATDEARRALAKALGVSPSRVTLERGARSRMKVFSVEGVSVGAAREALGIPAATGPPLP